MVSREINAGNSEPLVPARKVVMVVDDEADLCRLVATVLTEYGYEVVSATDAESAKRILDAMAEPPDLLLADVVMPGTSGPMLADQLLARFGHGRVLFMSGYDDRLVVRRYVVEKGFDLIVKPFQLHNLCATVKKAIEAEPATTAALAMASTTVH